MSSPSAASEKVLSDLSNELMSPYCPGRTIASCPSDQARKLEEQILAEAEAGKSREQIEQSLVERFGPQIVGYAPQPVVLYGAAGAGLAGLLVLVWAGRRWRAAKVTTAAAPTRTAAASPISRRDRDRLDDALDEVDEF